MHNYSTLFVGVPKLIHTPSTSKQLKDLSHSIHSSFEDSGIFDTLCKKRVTKLVHAAQQSFVERALLMNENQVLFKQNCERVTGQSHSMTMVGVRRVVSHEDIIAAREKRCKSKVSVTRRKNSRADGRETRLTLEIPHQSRG
jgi:hypothetical protein